MTTIEITPARLHSLRDYFARGLSKGLGDANGQMCIMAAIALSAGETLNDAPRCVATAVAKASIKLNDSERWKSSASRADGLRDLAIASLGSAGVVNEVHLVTLLAERTIREIVPMAMEYAASVHPDKEHADAMRDAGELCRKEGTITAYAAANAANAAAYAANDAAYAANAAAAAAANAANDPEAPLRKQAQIMVEILRELGSPGCVWLEAA